MGYYTLFKLTIEAGDPDLLTSDDFKDTFRRITTYELDSLEEDMIKWYDYTENMQEISKLYPNTVFKLYGDGEERHDMWVEYYCNGEVIRALGEIVYPSVDVSELGGIKHRCPELFL